jgi:hypothetical protein
MRRKAYQGRLLLHLDFWDHVVHWRVLVGLGQGALVECRRLMGELMGRKRLRMLVLHAERIGILEVMGAEGMMVEAVQVSGGCNLAGVESAFRGGQGQWGS